MHDWLRAVPSPWRLTASGWRLNAGGWQSIAGGPHPTTVLSLQGCPHKKMERKIPLIKDSPDLLLHTFGH